MILRICEQTGFRCDLIQVLRYWRQLGPVSHSISPHTAPQRLYSLPGIPVAAKPQLPPSLPSRKKKNEGTLIQIPGPTRSREAWVTCPFPARTSGTGASCAHWWVWVRPSHLEREWGLLTAGDLTRGMKEWGTVRRQRVGMPVDSIQPVFTPSVEPLVVFFGTL